MKIAFSSILETIEQAKLKFDFSALFQTQPDVLRDVQIYKSDSAGVKDWSFPAENQMKWENPLTAIASNGSEFNFVFKDEKTSDAPMSGPASIVVKIDPPSSIVRKIIVSYDQIDYTEGFKLFDAEGTCVLEIGIFSRQTKEILLEAKDRIVGFRSRLHKADGAWHNSLVIVIARRE